MCPIIQSMSAYEPRKKWMSKTKDEVFKYECIHSTLSNKVRYMYSKINTNGHFNISKIIFGDSGINNPIIDIEGKYGMTQHSMAIEVKDIDEANNIKKAITTEKFKKFIKNCSFSTFAIDWNIFLNLKRDFWKEFI
jgi:hypothetical protein